MISSRFIVRFLLTGLALSVLLLSTYILDFTLLPRFICLSVFIGLTVYLISRSGSVLHIKLDAITGSYLLYCCLCCISILWAINKAEALFEISKTILSMLVFLLTYFALKYQRSFFMEMTAKFSILFFFILLSAAIYQYTKIEQHSAESRYAITGLNGHKNLFASFLFLNLFFLVLAFKQLNAGWKIAGAISAICTLLLLLLLKTKAVWLGGIIFLIIFTILSLYRLKNPKPLRWYYLKLIGGLVVMNLFFICVLQPVIRLGLNRSAGPVKNVMLDEERLVIWNKTYDLFHKHPVIGVGAGNWQVNFPDATLTGLWRAEDLNYTFQRPHNDFLWILSETGIIGLNLFFIFIFSLFIYLHSALRSKHLNTTDAFEIRLCFAFIAAYFVVSFFDFPKERIEHNVLIHLIFGISYFHIKSAGTVISFGGFRLTSTRYNLIMVLLFFIFLIGVFRYRGEYYTRKIYDYKTSNQQTLLISAGKSALSFAYTLDPTSVPISWYIGNAETLMPETRQNVLNDFKKAQAQNPYNRNVLNDLASAYTVNNDIETAKKYYEEAARISPRFDEPKLNLVAIYINEKNYKMADEWIKTLFHNSERRTQYQKIIEAFR